MIDIQVIFHVDELKNWNLVLANTKNLMVALQDTNLTVEILANSEAVTQLVQSSSSETFAQHLRELSASVKICSCMNSLRSLKIDPSSLFDFVSVVPSGVAELALKQTEGYAYIKP